MQKYHLEFILHIQDTPVDTIRNSISELGELLEITDCQDNVAKGKNFKINIETKDPTVIFDACAQFGRIKSVKIK
jgi:dihydroxyacetone kinase-like predicted kinase